MTKLRERSESRRRKRWREGEGDVDVETNSWGGKSEWKMGKDKEGRKEGGRDKESYILYCISIV